tara:strand:+ start:1180 stop:2052 length:873 start_codon:yes stop_codon:yes gene_type:complete
MQFDVVITNPPFQDSVNRNVTPHKLWIDFTVKTFEEWLVDGGVLIQVSPSSFMSPSNKILRLFKNKKTTNIQLNQEHHFPGIGSTIAYYTVYNSLNDGPTKINGKFSIELDDSVFYLPNDFCELSFSIHRKVIFLTEEKLPVEHDYVTCHNILVHKSDTLSKISTEKHIYPVFHTNKQIWYSSIKQPFLESKKVMWTRSGYTKPFYDKGTMGVTDSAYFVKVNSDEEGESLEHNLNSKLFQYIFTTAKWSGFGNDKVFNAIPVLPKYTKLTDEDMYLHFGITEKEQCYIK